MIKTAQDAYLAGRQAAMEKLAYDWLGDSGLSLGSLSEYRSTSNPAKLRGLQGKLESLDKTRTKAIEEERDYVHKIPLGDGHTLSINPRRLFYGMKSGSDERYTGVDPARHGIASYGIEGYGHPYYRTVPYGVKSLLSHSRYVARKGPDIDKSKLDTYIQKLKEIRKLTGGRQAALDLLELEPILGSAPVTVDILSRLTESELYDPDDIPALTDNIKYLTQGKYGDKRNTQLKSLVKKLKDIKRSKRALNEKIESEKSRGYKTYLTPQNINRLAILGGTAGGSYLGDFTPRAFGVSLGGSVVGNLLGGAAGAGINAFRGGAQSNLVPLIGSTTGAIGGGLAAGKYLS